MSKPRESDLKRGDLVAIQLRPRRFGLIWMITASAKRGFAFLEMAGFWLGQPTAAEARRARPARSELPLVVPGCKIRKGWFQGRVPSDFSVVGSRAPSAREIAYATNPIGTMVFYSAEGVREELHRSWRRTHDRAALDAELVAAEDRQAQRVAKRRATMTLPKMLRERIFTHWSEHWPSEVVPDARRIFRDATRELIALARRGTKREREAVLKRITTEFNALDARAGCIETSEREEIVARVEELARLVGATNTSERLTGHRDW